MGGMITGRTVEIGKSVEGHMEIIMKGQNVLFETEKEEHHICALATTVTDGAATIKITEIFEKGKKNRIKVGEIHQASPRELRFVMIQKE